jgi:hypothetical protein
MGLSKTLTSCWSRCVSRSTTSGRESSTQPAQIMVILGQRPCESSGMSWHELRAGVGLLLAVMLIVGWSLGIGLPLAAVIIWLLS